jgi:acyl-coenzyme A thioesterase PaaI-like protein
MGKKRLPRVWSESRLKWVLNLYPPFFFNRIRIVEMGPGCRTCRVRIKKSLFTRNLQGTTFGGTIYSAADPIYAMLLWQILAREGWVTQAWVRTSRIHFTRAAATDLELDFVLSDGDVHDALVTLNEHGRFSRVLKTSAVDREGRVCAEIETEVYMRVPRPEQHQKPVF